MTTTLEQQRAANALARVKELSAQKEDFKKAYRAYVDGLCPAVLMNGLGQALATEVSATGASEKAHKELYKSVSAWLTRKGGEYPGAKDVLQAMMTTEESVYLRAQAETLAWLEWHKKFCRSEFPTSAPVD